jgi:hypothetical protein
VPDSRNFFHSSDNFSSSWVEIDFILEKIGKKNFLYGILGSTNTSFVKLEHSKVDFSIPSDKRKTESMSSEKTFDCIKLSGSSQIGDVMNMVPLDSSPPYGVKSGCS